VAQQPALSHENNAFGGSWRHCECLRRGIVLLIIFRDYEITAFRYCEVALQSNIAMLRYGPDVMRADVRFEKNILRVIQYMVQFVHNACTAKFE